MNNELVSALWVSVKVSLLSSIIVMFLSCWLGALFAHSKSNAVRVIELFLYIPMAMPPVAVGFGLLTLVGPQSALGSLLSKIGIDIAFTFYGAVTACVVASLGIGVRCMKTAFQSLDQAMIDIARLHGASLWQEIRFIRLPMLLPSLMGALLLVFMRALGEFGATIVLAGNQLGETRTLSLAIWTSLQRPGREREALMLMVISIVMSMIMLLLSELALQKKSPHNF